MSSELTDPFSTRDQPSTAGGSTGGAVIIPMFGEASTPPNIRPTVPPPYESAPPPVTVPYGWRMVREGDRWVMEREPAEWSVIVRCVEGRRSGRLYDAIAGELAAEDAPVWNETRRDHENPRWHEQRVRRLVGRYAPELKASRGSRPKARPALRHNPADSQDFEDLLDAAEHAFSE